MTDVIINQTKIVIEAKESDIVVIDSTAPNNSPIVETQVDEPQIALSYGNTFLSTTSAKEIDFEAECGEVIPEKRYVYLDNSGKAFLGSYLVLGTAQVIGMSKVAGAIGERIKFLVFGRIDDASFVYPSGTPLFLTTAGQFSSVAVGSGINKEVGQGLQTGSIFVNIKPAMLYSI